MTSGPEFIVDDTSPTISYLPFGDTFSQPNLGAGWNPYWTQTGFATVSGEVGNGSSLHITSRDGASLSLQWKGTGIRLVGNATSASYSITLDGSDYTSDVSPSSGVLAEISNLNDTSHIVSLTAHIPQGLPSAMLVFDYAVVFPGPLPVDPSSNLTTQVVDDDTIAFLGQWSFKSFQSTNLEFHTSARAGDRAVASFRGTTLLIQGVTSPMSGNYTVSVDNSTASVPFSARSSFTTFDSLLFFTTGLDPDTAHSVEVRNDGGGDLALLVNGFTTLTQGSPQPPTPMSTSHSFSKGELAALALGGLLAFILITGSIYFFCVIRPRRRRRKQNTRAWNERTEARHHQQQHPKEREAALAGAGNGGAGSTAGGPLVIDISSEAVRNYSLYGHNALENDDDDDERGIGYGGRRGFQHAYSNGQHLHSGANTGTTGTPSSGFARWKRSAAVDGSSSADGTSLPLHFAHSDDDDRYSNVKNSEKKRQNLDEDDDGDEGHFDHPLSSNLASASNPLSSRHGRRGSSDTSRGRGVGGVMSTIKDKTRQLTGKRSWSPSFKLDLPLGSVKPSQSRSQMRTGGGSGSVDTGAGISLDEDDRVSSFVAAPRSPRDQAEPPSYAMSVSQRGSDLSNLHKPPSNPHLSIGHSTTSSNGSGAGSVPSGPRTVSSRSPVFVSRSLVGTTTSVGPSGTRHGTMHSHVREDSGAYLLHGTRHHLRATSDSSASSAGSEGHDRHHAEERDHPEDDDIIGPDALQQVIRTLSPRIEGKPRRDHRHSYDLHRMSVDYRRGKAETMGSLDEYLGYGVGSSGPLVLPPPPAVSSAPLPFSTSQGNGNPLSSPPPTPQRRGRVQKDDSMDSPNSFSSVPLVTVPGSLPTPPPLAPPPKRKRQEQKKPAAGPMTQTLPTTPSPPTTTSPGEPSDSANSSKPNTEHRLPLPLDLPRLDAFLTVDSTSPFRVEFDSGTSSGKLQSRHVSLPLTMTTSTSDPDGMYFTAESTTDHHPPPVPPLQHQPPPSAPPGITSIPQNKQSPPPLAPAPDQPASASAAVATDTSPTSSPPPPQPFRLTPLTFPTQPLDGMNISSRPSTGTAESVVHHHSHHNHNQSQSQYSKRTSTGAAGQTSFLDFTSSYEPSIASVSQKHYSRSIKTSVTGGTAESGLGFGMERGRYDSDVSMMPPLVGLPLPPAPLSANAELKSRWSATTIPSVSTRDGSKSLSSSNGSGSGSDGAPTSQGKTRSGKSRAGKTQPPPPILTQNISSASSSAAAIAGPSSRQQRVIITQDPPSTNPSPSHPPSLPTTRPAEIRRSLNSVFTQNVDHLHEHPLAGDAMDSPTDSIPISIDSDLRFHHSVSEDHHSRPSAVSFVPNPNQMAVGVGAVGGARQMGLWTTSNLITAPSPIMEEGLGGGGGGSSSGYSQGHSSTTSHHHNGHQRTTTIEEEVNRIPFDPSSLVSRVLGMPSPASFATSGTTGTIGTVRPGNAGVGHAHSRTQSSIRGGPSPGPGTPIVQTATGGNGRSYSPFSASTSRFDSLKKGDLKKG